MGFFLQNYIFSAFVPSKYANTGCETLLLGIRINAYKKKYIPMEKLYL